MATRRRPRPFQEGQAILESLDIAQDSQSENIHARRLPVGPRLMTPFREKKMKRLRATGWKEAGDASVSLDLIVRALLAAGASHKDVQKAFVALE